MAGFSSATLERIRAASDIVDVIGSYLPLKKAGLNFVALCPFHKEKTPSFNVSPHRQIFHCFGCHKGGDVFTFVKEYENIGFVDAVRRLADRAKISIELDQSPGEKLSRHLKDQLLEIHEQIAQRWQNCLLNEAAGQVARDYLAKRDVPPEAVKLFRLGAAPDLWDDTVNWAKSKGHELTVVEKAGLVVKKAESGKAEAENPELRNYYDRFRGRLMFPICDEQGRVIGFSGRVLSGDEKTAKYVNSPETPIFTKSRVFFGLDKSKRPILDAGYAIICEGQLDLIACFLAGVQNVVAPQGTAFTDQHARILKRYVDEVVLCFDSDEAGQNAAVRSLDQLLASGLAVRVAIVPAPHDPDSYIKANGGEAFRKLVESAEGFFDYYLKRLCTQNDPNSDKGRNAILRGMAEAVHKTDNAVLTDIYAQKTAQRLNVSVQAIRSEFRRIPITQNVLSETEAVLSEIETLPPSDKELWLLKILFLRDDLVAWAALHLDVNWISHPLVRQIVARRFSAQTNETWKSLAAFLDECETSDMRSLITQAVADNRKNLDLEKLLKGKPALSDSRGLLEKMRDDYIDRRITIIKNKLNQSELSDTEKVELLREQKKIGEQRRAPLRS